MKRKGIPDVNTPDNYDNIYFGPRTKELLAHKYILDLLTSLNKRKGNVLDVGCGVGRYFSAFKGSKIYGTELSWKAIAKVKQDYPDAIVTQWFAGTLLPFQDNFFNLVWAGEFLEHIQDPQQTIDEIYRVLAPNGIGLFITPVGESSKCPEHLWFFSQEEIEELFSKFPCKEITQIVKNTRFQIVLIK